MKLPRLSPSKATRQAVSDAMFGHVTSEETKAKISASLKGHKVSEESRKKMSEAAKKRKKKTDEEVIEEAKRSRWAYQTRGLRERRWKKDMLEALAMGSKELFEDVKQSRGWTCNRKLRDPSGRVSDGVPNHRPGTRKAMRLQKVR